MLSYGRSRLVVVLPTATRMHGPVEKPSRALRQQQGRVRAELPGQAPQLAGLVRPGPASRATMATFKVV